MPNWIPVRAAGDLEPEDVIGFEHDGGATKPFRNEWVMSGLTPGSVKR